MTVKMTTSHKQFILLTGRPGVGKTTLVRKVCKILHEKNYRMSGFFTEEVRKNRERIGFDIVSLDGRRGALARVANGDTPRGPKVGKYTVNMTSIDSLCLPQFTELDKNVILVLDEVGKMELCSEKFRNKVDEYFRNGKQVILGTVPVKDVNPISLVEKIKCHPNSLMISVDRMNRNSLVDDIVKYVIEAVAST